MSEIKNLVNEECWNDYVEKNTDGYGMAAINVARNVMQYLDEHDVEFNIGYRPDMTTPHGIICHCDDQGGITGFQASCVSQAVAKCYKDGWKFWLANAISPLDVKTDNMSRVERKVEIVTRAMIDGVINTGLPNDVLPFVDGLIKRYKDSSAKEPQSVEA
jgi:hypothetical protein